jgi:hypothetical protein
VSPSLGIAIVPIGKTAMQDFTCRCCAASPCQKLNRFHAGLRALEKMLGSDIACTRTRAAQSTSTAGLLTGYKSTPLRPQCTSCDPVKTHRSCAAQESLESILPLTAVVAGHGFVVTADLLPRTGTTLRLLQTPRQEEARLMKVSLALGPGALCCLFLSSSPW